MESALSRSKLSPATATIKCYYITNIEAQTVAKKNIFFRKQVRVGREISVFQREDDQFFSVILEFCARSPNVESRWSYSSFSPRIVRRSSILCHSRADRSVHQRWVRGQRETDRLIDRRNLRAIRSRIPISASRYGFVDPPNAGASSSHPRVPAPVDVGFLDFRVPLTLLRAMPDFTYSPIPPPPPTAGAVRFSSDQG